MSGPLYVAAGGGGDALAALILHHATTADTSPPVVVSYSWDRHLLDPTPGPRVPADFQHLRRLTDHTWEVTRESHLPAGGISGLALLARHTDARFILLDPTHGAVGMHHQLTELINHLSADLITLVDAGGDIAAHGHEPTLRSPLGDSLALAATAGLNLPANVAVVGPGLDGELADTDIRHDMTTLDAHTHTLQPADVEAYLPALHHHPSEATMLVIAAALGIRGRVEIRDAGALVDLTASSADVLTAPADAVLAINNIAQKLVATQSFRDAEAITTSICGTTELDHERRKAHTLANHRPAEPAT
ncbi:MAG: hypothetical protein QOC94_2100, partial [Actinoplanes sp.]|nr:hypothetical protein [Actinoplanes sp.]